MHMSALATIRVNIIFYTTQVQYNNDHEWKEKPVDFFPISRAVGKKRKESRSESLKKIASLNLLFIGSWFRNNKKFLFEFKALRLCVLMKDDYLRLLILSSEPGEVDLPDPRPHILGTHRERSHYGSKSLMWLTLWPPRLDWMNALRQSTVEIQREDSLGYNYTLLFSV